MRERERDGGSGTYMGKNREGNNDGTSTRSGTCSQHRRGPTASQSAEHAGKPREDRVGNVNDDVKHSNSRSKSTIK